MKIWFFFLLQAESMRMFTNIVIFGSLRNILYFCLILKRIESNLKLPIALTMYLHESIDSKYIGSVLVAKYTFYNLLASSKTYI